MTVVTLILDTPQCGRMTVYKMPADLESMAVQRVTIGIVFDVLLQQLLKSG